MKYHLKSSAQNNNLVFTTTGQRVVELLPEPAPEAEEDAAYEEVVVVKKRGRGRPKKIKEEELETEGTNSKGCDKTRKERRLVKQIF